MCAQLSWDALSAADRDLLLDLVASPDGAPAHLSGSEIEKLKQLPLFETLGGERVALAGGAAGADGGYFTLESSSDSSGGGGQQLGVPGGLPMPTTTGGRFLVVKPALRDLYTDIGVSRLSESGVVSKFLLPEFGAMDAAQQASMLAYVKAHWETLKADEPLVAALKEVAFVPCGPAGQRVLTKPSALFDPRHELLAEIFRHRPGDGGGGDGGSDGGGDGGGDGGSAAFPGGEFARTRRRGSRRLLVGGKTPTPDV